MLTVAHLVIVATVLPTQIDPLPFVGSLSEPLRGPARVAVAADGTVLVTDPRGYQIVRFDSAGAFLGTWPVPDCPVGVAVHPDGRYFVSYRDEPGVGIYDAGFTRTGLLGEGDPLVSFVRPTALGIASDTGRIYVVDSGGDRVYGFEDDGTLALIFGERGESFGQFKYPSALAVDEMNGRLIVADQDNFRVQVFTMDGVFTLRFGYRNKYLPSGNEEGWMPRTLGLAVDAQSYLYVADAMMSAVRVFDPSRIDLGKVVAYGESEENVRAATDVALSPDGQRLYVVSSNTASVKVFSAPDFGAMTSAAHAASSATLSPPGTNHSPLDAAYRRGVPQLHSALGRKEMQRLFFAPNGRLSDGFEGSDSAHPTSQSDFEGPHMIDATIVCGRCHGIVGQPGGHPGTVEGQAALCFSCHNSGGQAMSTPLSELDRADGSGGDPGRSHAWGVSAVSETFGSTGPNPGGEMERYLDGSGLTKCSTCHNQHSNDAGAPYMRVSNAGGAMCKECHTSHIDHTPSGGWLPDCSECHKPHNPAGENLSLVATSVVNQTLGTEKPVRFTARTGANSFDDGDPAAHDGICQVCHTLTTYHTHDGTGAAHNDGTTCTNCHPHEAGFLPAGGDCASCHAGPQDNGDGLPAGGRRAVTGEFPADDAHAHYGAELDSSACTVCHDVTTHMNGYVELLDADGGALYSFATPDDLASDPDLSDFCVGCHDADGATRLASPFDPFGNGNAPPDVASRFAGTLQWNEMYGGVCFPEEGMLRAGNSHHDLSDADQVFSGAKLECLNCHGAHSASASQPVADPFDTTTAWAGSSSEFCLSCHGGGTGPLNPGFPPGVWGPIIDPTDPRWVTLGFDWTTILGGACLTDACSSLRGIESCDYGPGPWYVDYSWTHSAHGPDSKRGWAGYSGALGADMACMECHDPHGSATVANPAGNPYMIRDMVDGTPFVDDGTRGGGFNGPPFETYGTARDVAVTVSGLIVDWGSETSLCSACHADWLSAYDFHSFCGGCQTCHAHGAAFGEHDWGPESNNTPCPLPASASGLRGESRRQGRESMAAEGAVARPALHQWDAGPAGLGLESLWPTNHRKSNRQPSHSEVSSRRGETP